jgi:predicted dehydrogenase
MHPAHPLLSPAMSPLAALRWGVVGCGDVCAHKSGPALAQPRSSVHAVARRTPGAAAAYAAEHGIPAAYEASSALLADPACNAVYIATPPDSHAALAVAAAAAGKPTLLEKPMARCAAEAAAVAAVFERAGVPLFVAYYRRCLPRYVRVRELLPRVGEVTGVRAEVRFKPEAGGVCGGGGGWRFERDVGGGGLFVDVGSHVLDLLDFLLGPVRVECSEFGDAHTSSWVAADADAYSGVEDRMVAAVSFALAPAAGADNLLAFDFRGAPAGADRVTITGAEGELSFPALGLYDSAASVTSRSPIPPLSTRRSSRPSCASSSAASPERVPAPQRAA